MEFFEYENEFWDYEFLCSKGILGIIIKFLGLVSKLIWGMFFM